MKEEDLRRNHTSEFKLECCRQVATGQKRPAQICREHSLSESVLLRWRREYEARGEAAFTEKQLSESEALERKIAELERFCGKLALENEVLKKGLKRYHSGGGTP
jgi:transposase